MGKWVGTRGGETCSQNILYEKSFLKKDCHNHMEGAKTITRNLSTLKQGAES